MSKKIGYIKIGRRHVHFVHLFMICIALLGFVYVLIGSIESAYIAKNGIETKGNITRIAKRGSKGGKVYSYQFSFDNRTYTGKALYLKLDIGDEVDVIFIPKNPNKNRVIDELIKTYGIFLKMNPNKPIY
jgi:hypothetical protein